MCGMFSLLWDAMPWEIDRANSWEASEVFHPYSLSSVFIISKNSHRNRSANGIEARA
jgi:hypothetical protein